MRTVVIVLHPRPGLINAFQPGRPIPQGLKPSCSLALGGTAEAVPFPKTIYETSPSGHLDLFWIGDLPPESPGRWPGAAKAIMTRTHGTHFRHATRPL